MKGLKVAILFLSIAIIFSTVGGDDTGDEVDAVVRDRRGGDMRTRCKKDADCWQGSTCKMVPFKSRKESLNNPETGCPYAWICTRPPVCSPTDECKTPPNDVGYCS